MTKAIFAVTTLAHLLLTTPPAATWAALIVRQEAPVTASNNTMGLS